MGHSPRCEDGLSRVGGFAEDSTLKGPAAPPDIESTFDAWKDVLSQQWTDIGDTDTLMQDLVKGIDKSADQVPLAALWSSSSLGAKPITESVSTVNAENVNKHFTPKELLMREYAIHLEKLDSVKELHCPFSLEGSGRTSRELRIMLYVRDRFGLAFGLYCGYIKAFVDIGGISAVKSSSMATIAYQQLGLSSTDLDLEALRLAVAKDITYTRRNAALILLHIVEVVQKLTGEAAGQELQVRDLQGRTIFVKRATLHTTWKQILDGTVDLPGGASKPTVLSHLIQNGILLSSLILRPYGKPLMDKATVDDVVMLPPLVTHHLNEALVALPTGLAYQRPRLALQCSTTRRGPVSALGSVPQSRRLQGSSEASRGRFTTGLASHAASLKTTSW